MHDLSLSLGSRSVIREKSLESPLPTFGVLCWDSTGGSPPTCPTSDLSSASLRLPRPTFDPSYPASFPALFPSPSVPYTARSVCPLTFAFSLHNLYSWNIVNDRKSSVFAITDYYTISANPEQHKHIALFVPFLYRKRHFLPSSKTHFSAATISTTHPLCTSPPEF